MIKTEYDQTLLAMKNEFPMFSDQIEKRQWIQNNF